MLVQANPESTLKHHPVKKMETTAQIISSDRGRAKEIAKSREEMLSLLHDMPESDYELSLTDIIDKKSSSGQKEKEKEEELEKDQKNLHKGINKAERRRSNSGKSLRCSSDGVLLNFYTPTSILTRSLTTPKTCTTKILSMPPTTSIDYTTKSCRENEMRTLKFMGCWSLLWDRRGKGNKSKRQNQNQHQHQHQSQFQFQFHS